MDENKRFIYVRPKEYQNSSWFNYATGYKEASLLILNGFENSNDFFSKYLVFPVFFLFRQFTELMLKGIIAEYAEFNNNPIKIPKKHDIGTLWRKVKPIANDILFVKFEETASKLKPVMTKESLTEIENIILELDRYDKHATSFRFPIDTSGKISLNSGFEVQISTIKNAINQVFSVLNFISFSMTVLKL